MLWVWFKFFGEGNGTPLQHSCLENPMDGGAWWAAVHGVAKSRTRLSNFTFAFPFHALEKEMATHSSALAWRIPGTREPHGLPSMGLHRVRHNWSDLAAAAAELMVDVTLCINCVTIWNEVLLPRSPTHTHSLPGPHSFIYIHPLNTRARCGVPDGAVDTVSLLY